MLTRNYWETMQKKREYYEEEEEAIQEHHHPHNHPIPNPSSGSTKELFTVTMINNRRQGHCNEISKPSSFPPTTPLLPPPPTSSSSSSLTGASSEGNNYVFGGRNNHKVNHSSSHTTNTSNIVNNKPPTAMTSSLHLRPSSFSIDALAISSSKATQPYQQNHHHGLSMSSSSHHHLPIPKPPNSVGTNVIRRANKSFGPTNNTNYDSNGYGYNNGPIAKANNGNGRSIDNEHGNEGQKRDRDRAICVVDSTNSSKNSNSNSDGNSSNMIVSNCNGSSSSITDSNVKTEEGLEGGKPQKIPFFYCRTLGWDPALNKFHIQLDTMELESNPRDGNLQVTGEPGKSSMTSPNTSEKSSPSSSSSNNNKEKEQEQIVPNTEATVSQRAAARTSPNNTVPQAQTKKVVSEGESSDSKAKSEAENKRPDLQRISDLTSQPSTSNITNRMTGESAPVGDSELASAQKRLRLSGGSSTSGGDGDGEAILPGDLEKSPCSERDKPAEAAAELNDNDDDNDNDALVIDMRTEEEREADEAVGRNERVEGQGQDGGENDQNEGSSSSCQSNRANEAIPSPPTGGNCEGNNNQEGGNEDFRCQICHELFSTEKEVNDHFSSEHFRTVVNESILEPESPYPTASADGDAPSLMEDEMELPESMPVETQLIEFPETTLSTLLRRDSNDEGGAHPSHPLGHGGGPGQVILPMRQPFQPAGRGYPPPRMSPPFAIQSEHRPMGPPVSQPGMIRPSEFPSALHRALIDQHSQYRAPAPPPQLRPMPMSQMRGGGVMPSQHGGQHLQNRPPLTRVPSATQMSHMPTRNPNSILRPLGPPLQRPSTDEQVNNLRNKVRTVDDELRKTNIQALKESNPEVRQNLVARKNELMRIYQELSNQLLGHQQQQRQEFLQRQQMHQLDAQSLQQQQMRQHQLQQSTSTRPSADNAAGHQQQGELINANGKRPGGPIMDAGMLHDPKQPRFGHPHFSIQRNMQPFIETLQRVHNGMTNRTLPPAGSPSSAQIVKPGMNSGGSTGSRHSSGSTSPAIPSPVAQRLAHSGITLTSTSPSLPLTPLSPPANPNHSPISDTSLSPRGSPRIQVGHLVQNVMNTCGVPASAAISPGSASQPINSFIQPKPPSIPFRVNNDGRNPIVTISHADRPDRPPTVDLTDDDIQTHNAQMRATGRGTITQEQIQFHEATLQQRRVLNSIPGTSQFTIRPVSNSQGPSPQPSPNPQPSPPYNTSNEHGGIMIQRQVTVQPQATFRPPHPQHQQHQLQQQQQQQQQQQHPGVVIRRTPPITMPHIRSNNPTQAQGMPPQRPPMQMRERTPNPTIMNRQQSQPQSSPLSADAYQKLVIPLLYLDRLDQNKIRALNDIGVTSFIPLDRAANLGIPLLRLRPDVALGHFPHDTAVEIGPARPLPTVDQTRQQQVQRTPQTNIPVPSHAAAQPSRPHPQSVMSPPMGTICMDRSCSELLQQRPSPTSVIQRSMTHTHAPGNQISVRPIHSQPQPMNANVNQYQQQQQRSSHHESFLGGSSGQFGGGNRN